MKLRVLLKMESFNHGERFQAGVPGRFWREMSLWKKGTVTFLQNFVKLPKYYSPFF